MKEEFRPVVGYEGYYEVSNFGRIFSCERIVSRMQLGKYPSYYKVKAKELRPYKGHGNYFTVCFCKDDTERLYRINRLVARAFIPNPENKPEVNHKDGDKANNKSSNLEWATRLENASHAARTGLYKGLKGEDSPRAILTETQVIKIRDLASTGNYSHRELSQQFNVSRRLISFIIAKKRWSHV